MRKKVGSRRFMKFLLHTQIGIEKVAKIELFDKFKGLFSLDYVGFVPRRNGLVQIDWRSENYLLLDKLGTVEDVFGVLYYKGDIPYSATLKKLEKYIQIDEIKRNLSIFNEYYKLKFGKVIKSSTEFRLITRKKSPNAFRRVDLHLFLTSILERNKIYITEKEGGPEIWCTLVKNRLIIALRLTDSLMRHRDYKIKNVEGSLRPTVAYAMAYLTKIRYKDVVWDPFCGAGTIACEILRNFKFKRMICSDISDEAVQACKFNLAYVSEFDKYKSKFSFKVEDFFASKYYANLIITNLPFGRKYECVPDFIDRFNERINSVNNLRKVTILYSDKLKLHGWQLIKKFRVKLLGRRCYLQVHSRL